MSGRRLRKAEILAPNPRYRTEKEWRRLERENLLAALEAAGGRVSGPKGSGRAARDEPEHVDIAAAGAGAEEGVPGRSPKQELNSSWDCYQSVAPSTLQVAALTIGRIV